MPWRQIRFYILINGRYLKKNSNIISFFKVFAIYRDPKIFGILFLGFSSGLPFLLTLGTLQAWLHEVGISKTVMGLFALATIPYALKFLWAPVIDYVKIPYLTNVLGKRRSWILVSQFALMLSLVGLGFTNPEKNIYLTAFMTFIVCFCAASQDNVIEAYRVEMLDIAQSGPGAAASIIGFRAGMWVSGGGALYLAAHFSWYCVYSFMAIFMIIGMIATLLVKEPKSLILKIENTIPSKFLFQRFRFFYLNILKPAFSSFFINKQWYFILIFILLFKVGDTVLNMMSIPFLLEMGFAKSEIAHVAKTFGIFAMVIGGIIGGILLQRYSMKRNMLISLFSLMVSCFMFVVQAKLGHNISFLILTMGFENLACGMSAATLITYLSRMCLSPYTATHFALLSSFSSISRVLLSTLAGWLSDQMSWSLFFTIVALGCLPAIFIVFKKHYLFKINENKLFFEEKKVS